MNGAIGLHYFSMTTHPSFSRKHGQCAPKAQLASASQEKGAKSGCELILSCPLNLQYYKPAHIKHPRGFPWESWLESVSRWARCDSRETITIRWLCHVLAPSILPYRSCHLP